MSQREIQEFVEIIKKRQVEVTNSKEAAKALLIELGVLTPEGEISERFEGLTLKNDNV